VFDNGVVASTHFDSFKLQPFARASVLTEFLEFAVAVRLLATPEIVLSVGLLFGL
jgi:hypothetical protein